MKRRIHLVCNAHLDPVWLWEWQEGAAETISTFRTAAELCEKNSAFVFNHNEVILYEWIREYEPSLFERIQKLVQQGRWHIMGGWYLQPDCNMPSGESFVRQILAGRGYFLKHFGVYPKTAINFDPFGHSRGLVQIMAKSGFTSYLFGRPHEQFKHIEEKPFVWVGVDGSEVLARRFPGWYNTAPGQSRVQIEERITQTSNPVEVILWGVGNHGGGPSRKDLADVTKLIKERKDIEILHSTPDAYFAEVEKNAPGLKRHADDLNPWAIGCYTSMIRVKQKHRLLENELYLTEKMAACAAANGLMDYPQADFNTASRDLMFGQFHDILPGSSIQPAEEAALRLMDHGLEILSRIKMRSFFALAAGQKKATEGNIPILVYNPYPYKVNRTVECEFNLPDFNNTGTFTNVFVFRDEKPIAAQVEREVSNNAADWRKRIVFHATLEPGQINRFDCTLKVIPRKPPVKLKAKNGVIRYKTDRLLVDINTKTGLLDRYRLDRVDYVAKGAFCPVVLQDNEDPWEVKKVRFGKVVGKFKLLNRKMGTKLSGLESTTIDSVRVIEDGAVRVVIEAVLGFEESFICQRYAICKHSNQIEVETRVFWNQKNRMLKLAVPLAFDADHYVGQTAFGVQELPTNGNEAVAQKWVCAASRADNKALSCINDGIYGSDLRDGQLRLSLLRSAAYSGHPIGCNDIIMRDRFTPRIDQGERVYKFWFNAGPVKSRLSTLSAEALQQNEKPFALSFFPLGSGQTPKPLALINNPAIELSAFKKAERSADWIVRLFNTSSRKQTADITLPALGSRQTLAFGPYEIKTLNVNTKGKAVPVNLVEEKI